MPSVSCSRCRHANPPGAKFCNECGCATRSKPCERCGSLNALDAQNCRRCSGDFPDATLPIDSAANSAAVSQARAAENASGSTVVRAREAVAEQPTSFQVGL